MKIFYTFLLFTFNIYGQWQLINPKITLFDIAEIEIKKNKAIFLNTYGEVFRSFNNYNKWEKISQIDPTGFSKMFFADTSYGWMLYGYKNYYYYTVDGGYHWNNRFLDFQPKNIFFYDSLNGISSSQDTLYLTKDGGKTYFQISDSVFKNLFLVDFIMKNKSNIIVLTNQISESDDGGLTWNSHIVPHPSYFTDFYEKLIFQDSTTGFLITNYMEVLKTVNGGKSWVSKLEPDPDGHHYLEDADFFGNTGFITKDILWFLPKTNNKKEYSNKKEYEWFNILRTTDNGENWEEINNNQSKFYEPAIKVEGINDSTFLFSGHNGFLCITTDKGETFNSINHTEYLGRIFGIKFVNDKNGFIVANKIYKTYDGGKSFEKYMTNYDGLGILKCAAMPDTNTFIVAVHYPGDYIIKSTDLGKTWKRTFIDATISEIKFENENVGYLCSGKGLFKTTDKGDSWNIIYPSSYSVEPLDSENVWLSASSKILYSSDRGNNWIVQAYTSVDRVSFVDKNFGIAGSTSFYYTTNGGSNWLTSAIQGINTYDEVKALKYIKVKDRLYGFVSIGDFDEETGITKTYFTLDSGKTWIRDMDVPNSLDHFSFAGNTLWGGSFRRGFLIKRNDFETITNIQPEIKSQPNSFTLSQNYPNPFNPSTKIKYTLPKQGLVTIKVYDVLGKEIATLINEEKPSGEYEVEFNGSSLSSGIYFYQIQAGGFLETKKMVLMK